MSNHRCLYPHIPISYSKPVVVCFMPVFKLYLASWYVFTVQDDQQVWTLHNLIFFLSFCHVLDLPVSDAFIPLNLSLSVSLLTLCFFPAVSLPKKCLMHVPLICLRYKVTIADFSPFLLSVFNSAAHLHTFSLSGVVAHYCFCLKCTYQLVYLFCACCSPHNTSPFNMAAGKWKFPLYFLPT